VQSELQVIWIGNYSVDELETSHLQTTIYCYNVMGKKSSNLNVNETKTKHFTQSLECELL
jgi:hypothetical protein